MVRGSVRPARARVLVTCVVAAFLSAVGGCGSPSDSSKPTGKLTVKVTYGGQPVTEGQVDLSRPDSGEGGGGPLDQTGTATISQVPTGNYTVTVVPPPENPAPPEPGQPAPVAKKYPNIPEKFRIAKTSPLKAEVKQGTSEVSFELKE